MDVESYRGYFVPTPPPPPLTSLPGQNRQNRVKVMVKLNKLLKMHSIYLLKEPLNFLTTSMTRMKFHLILVCYKRFFIQK